MKKVEKRKCRLCLKNDAIPKRTRCNTCVSRLWRAREPYKDAFNNLRHHAKERGIGFLLTFDFFEFACKSVDWLNRRGKEAESLTFDRPDADLPYSDDNFDFLTNKDNAIKWHMIDKLKREKWDKARRLLNQ